MYKETIIRMRKKGHLKDITYDLVVSYKDKRHRGDYLERVGFYSPHLKDNYLFINSVRLAYWLNKGAKINKKAYKCIAQMACAGLVKF